MCHSLTNAEPASTGFKTRNFSQLGKARRGLSQLDLERRDFIRLERVVADV